MLFFPSVVCVLNMSYMSTNMSSVQVREYPGSSVLYFMCTVIASLAMPFISDLNI